MSLSLAIPVFSPFIICAAMVFSQRRLIHLKMAGKRTVLYVALIIAVAALFFTTEFVVEKFIYNNDEVVDIAVATVGAFVFAKFRSFFDTMTDAIFFRGEYDYAKSVGELGPLLHETIDLKYLLGLLNAFLLRTIKPAKIIFLLDNGTSSILFGASTNEEDAVIYEERYRHLFNHYKDHFRETIFIQALPQSNEASELKELADQAEIAAIVPLYNNGAPSACMLLGRKLSNDIFRPKDIQLLGVIAHHASMAIENARLYEEIRKNNEELEMKILERTEKIASLYEERSRFFTDISHELQTPIAILRGNVEVLQQIRNARTDAPVQTITHTLDGMARLVNHLLENARLKFSKNKFFKTEIFVSSLIEEAYQDCHVLAEHKKVELLRRGDESLCILADKDKLKEVLLNLISNALKHTSAGGEIRLSHRKSQGSAEIIVQDTGSGIAPEDLPRIFERFYRMEHGTVPGTGIGLSICRQIIEGHGGTITADSSLGKGSRFIIQLPLVS